MRTDLSENLTLQLADVHPDFLLWEDHVRLGRAFAFIHDLPADGPRAHELHGHLYGALSTPGSTTSAIFPRLKDGVRLPGCRVLPPPQSDDTGALGMLLPDKDVYRAGEDVARLFLFMPFRPNASTEVKITCGGNDLDTLPVTLDRNGCAMVRYSAAAVGQFQAQVPDGPQASFEVARYTLAPLSVSLASLKRERTLLMLRLSAESYGLPYANESIVQLLENGEIRKEQRANFSAGDAEMMWELGALSGQLSLRVTDAADKTLVAAVPLPGTRKADRDETLICRLGRVTSASLLPSTDSTPTRGLHVSQSASTNSYIAVDSCIGTELHLTFRKAATDAVIFLRSAIDHSERVHRIGAVSPGRTVVVPLEAPFGTFDVGAFIDGAAWEGNGVFIRTPATTIKLTVPQRADPGSQLTIGISTSGPASVLLKVRDVRMRTLDHPMTAAGRIVKQWAGKITGDQRYGDMTRSFGAPGAVLRRIENEGLFQRKALDRIQAKKFALPMFEVGEHFKEDILERMPWNICLESNCIPIGLENNRIQLAASDPSDLEMLKTVQFVTQREPEVTAYISPSALGEIMDPCSRWRGMWPAAWRKASLSASISLKKACEILHTDEGNMQVLTATGRLRGIRDRGEFKFWLKDVQALITQDICYDDERVRGMRILPGSPLRASLRGFSDDDLDIVSNEEGVMAQAVTTEYHRMMVSECISSDDMIDCDSIRECSEAPMIRPSRRSETPAAPPSGRTSEADLLFCDLLTVDGPSVITMALPDAIGIFDVEAFAVSNGDWAPATERVRVEKESYLEPAIPVLAHPDDGAMCRAVAVRPPADATFGVWVDGVPAHFDTARQNDSLTIVWPAVPGVHRVAMRRADGELLDAVDRVVEAPGEEIVLSQEMRILPAGTRFERASEPDVLSLRVLPGIESELTVAVGVVLDFGHACCEQSSAIIGAACAAVLTGDSGSSEKGRRMLIQGEKRMASMFDPKRGFRIYPESNEVIPEWSLCAARRLAQFRGLLEGVPLQPSIQSAVENLSAMGAAVLALHKNSDRGYGGPLERLYYGDAAALSAHAFTDAEIQRMKQAVGQARYYADKAESAFGAACLLRKKLILDGIDVANAVAKAMGGALGGGTHGSYEILAYMHMVHELKSAGVVPGAGSRVRVDGVERQVREALGASDVRCIEALDAPVAIRINRLRRLRLDTMHGAVPIVVSLTGSDGSAVLRAGKPATLRVILDQGYKAGDMLVVTLPSNLCRMIGGAQSRKFQVDFRNTSKVEVELLALDASERPRQWTAAVRNMYDGERIGSVGPMKTVVLA